MQTINRRRSDVASGIGITAFLFGAWLLIYRDGYDSLAWVSLTVGAILLLLDFSFYIRAKGYHPAWALLFLLFGPVAFFVFFYLPDRHRENQHA